MPRPIVYTVSTAEDLRAAIDQVTSNHNGIINIENDINLSELSESWIPIAEAIEAQNPGSIVIHGNGHVVGSELYPLTASLIYQAADIEIDNLNLYSYYYYDDLAQLLSSDASYFGLLICVASRCKIHNCTVKGKVLNSPADSTGGLVGKLSDGEIVGCINELDITAGNGMVPYGFQRVGGIVGDAINSIIDSCINNGNLISDDVVGGIVSICSSCIVRNCVNSGTICDVDDEDSVIGGIVGSVIEGDPSMGDVHDTIISDNINKGIIGACTLSNAETAGGIVGTIEEDDNVGSKYYIINNMNICSVKGKMFVGGIIGNTMSFENNHEAYLYVRYNDNLGNVYGNATGEEIYDFYNDKSYVGNTGIGGIIGANSMNALIEYNRVCAYKIEQKYSKDIFQYYPPRNQAMFVGGVVGVLSDKGDYDEAKSDATVRYNYARVGELISEFAARRIVGGICSRGQNKLENNYADAATRLTADNRNGYCYKNTGSSSEIYSGETIDCSDPDYGADNLNGENLDPAIHNPPVGDSFNECLRGVYTGCRNAAAGRRASSVAQYAAAAVVSNIACLETRLRDILDIGATMMQRGLAGNPSADDLASLNAEVTEIIDSAGAMETSLVDRLCSTTDYLTKLVEVCGCNGDDSFLTCATLYAATENSRQPAQMVKYRLINESTGEVTSNLITDQTGKLELMLAPGSEYTLEMMDDGEWIPETRHIKVDVDGSFTVDGQRECCKGTCTMIVHRPDYIGAEPACATVSRFGPVCKKSRRAPLDAI
ncbi:MAG: hypothetical protein LBS72_03210 [Oscillospiraceae bacterium]|nr:hypothetical protein [Oscillospiraceae bacterium]